MPKQGDLSLNEWGRALLVGIGQIMFQASPWSGLFFLSAVAWSSWWHGLALLVGTAFSTLAAVMNRFDSEAIRQGMFGFNGGLVGIALLCFLPNTPSTWFLLGVAAFSSSWMMAAFQAALKPWDKPALTAPFVFTTLLLLLGKPAFDLWPGIPPSLPPSPPLAPSWDALGVAHFLFNGLTQGLSQVFLQANAISGLLIAAGLLVGAPSACGLALLGSWMGMLVALGLGAPWQDIQSGLHGYNAALVAMALYLFLQQSPRRRVALAIVGAALSPWIATATGLALATFKLPALTLPFVLVTWGFLLADQGSKKPTPSATD